MRYVHIRQKAKAGQGAWSAFRSLANTERGIGPAAMRTLYIACVVPVLLYGAEVWWRGVASDATPLQKSAELGPHRHHRRISDVSLGSPT